MTFVRTLLKTTLAKLDRLSHLHTRAQKFKALRRELKEHFRLPVPPSGGSSGNGSVKPPQEKSLSRRLEIIDRLERRVRTEMRVLVCETLYPPAKARAKADRIRHAMQAVESAKHYLSAANCRLVVSEAKKYRGRGLAFGDLIGEGNIGLMRAVDKYDHRLGWKFGTYATWWIRQALQRAVTQQSKAVHTPANQATKLQSLRESWQALSHELNREPSDHEIAQRSRMTTNDVSVLRPMLRTFRSLNEPASQDHDGVLADFIADTNAPAGDRLPHLILLRERLTFALRLLNVRDRAVVSLRFGLFDGNEYTLEDVGAILKVTRERVRQIEARVIKDLRPTADKLRLSDFLQTERVALHREAGGRSVLGGDLSKARRVACRIIMAEVGSTQPLSFTAIAKVIVQLYPSYKNHKQTMFRELFADSELINPEKTLSSAFINQRQL